MQSRGFRVTNVKCDMYVNIDAGTIRPTEHGEVFVGEDGIEADQDLGNYERFTGNAMKAENYITTGQVYQEVIRRERNLEYGGEDVEVVPDIPNEIIKRIRAAAKLDNAEITIVEFGGTVGEYQVLLFLEAARMMKRETSADVAFVLVSYLPIPSHIGEMKTKPTQYASRTLNEAGIQADFVVARGPQALDQPRADRLATFCNLDKGFAISAPDVDSIYEVPLVLEQQQFSDKMLKRLHLKPKKKNLQEWKSFVGKIKNLDKELNIAVVGKYFGTGNFVLSDSYISVIEAVKHACWAQGKKPKLTWINSEDFEKNKNELSCLSLYDGILVPGGFGQRGVEGIIAAIGYARRKKIPYLGLCYGMQCAVIEYARHELGWKDAHTTEINPSTPHPVIDVMHDQKVSIASKNYGGTMRLGSFDCFTESGTRARSLYKKADIKERHRHRYEFNNKYRQELKKAGLVLSGLNKDRDLVEIIELKNHPFFMGVQFHPEFQSRPLQPHPLFLGFVKAAQNKKEKH